MRIAVKIFLAYSLVILVLAGIAGWSLYEVGKLSIADSNITVRAAEALHSAVSLREAVSQAKRQDKRSLVFDDPEYAAASEAAAARTLKRIERLGSLITTPKEGALVEKAAAGFKDYQTAVSETRNLRKRGNIKGAEKRFQDDAEPRADAVVADLDSLAKITSDALNQTQSDATAALGQARFEIEALRDRTWTAVTTAMILAVIFALAGTAAIAGRMHFLLNRLSDATRAVAEGAFHKPLPIDSRDEFGELAKSFNTMAARLREIDEIKEKFYSTVSHELRSPLNAMREATRLMETKATGPLTAKQQRLIAIFNKGTERLLRLVNSVLDLSRASAGMMPVERRWFDLDAAVKNAIEELRPQAEQGGIALKLDVGSGAEHMFGDEDRVVQVVVNLVGNALRFTSAGGAVTVKLRPAEGQIHIQVEDTGIGIPAALVPTVFDRFRQAHSGKGGTGLGLAIVKSLVEAHGGQVSVESREGKGTQFTASFPIEATAPAANEKEASKV